MDNPQMPKRKLRRKCSKSQKQMPLHRPKRKL